MFAVWEDAWYKKTNLALAQAGGPPVFTESTGSAIPVVNGCLVQQGREEFSTLKSWHVLPTS